MLKRIINVGLLVAFSVMILMLAGCATEGSAEPWANIFTEAPALNALENSTPEVVFTPTPELEALAFEWAYDSTYGWINESSFQRECIPVIIIWPDTTMLMSTNELEYMDIFEGIAVPGEDGLSYTCSYHNYGVDSSFKLIYQKDGLWSIDGDEASIPFLMYEALYTPCDVQEALERIDIIKNTEFMEPDN